MAEKAILKDFFNEKALYLAWERYIHSSPWEVKDYDGIRRFGSNLNSNLESLSAYIIDGKFKPTRPFKFFEPKSSGMQRTKSILIIEDAIVYQAIVNHIASENYKELAEFGDFVFGSVLSPEVEKGIVVLEEDIPNFYFYKYYFPLYQRFLESVNNEIDNEEIVFKFETDITGFFDCIPHSVIKKVLSGFNVDPIISEFLCDMLNKWCGTRYSATQGVGIPQGPIASFFIGNLILHGLDRILSQKSFGYYRYMDDLRIFSHNEKQLRNILVEIDIHLKGMGLSLNSKKTNIEKIIDREKEKYKIKRYLSFDEPDASEFEWKENKGSGNILDPESFSSQEISDESRAIVYEKMSDDEFHEYIKTEFNNIDAFFEKNGRYIKQKASLSFDDASESKAKERGKSKSLIMKMNIKYEESKESSVSVPDDEELLNEFRDISFRYRKAFRIYKAAEPEAEPDLKYLDYWFAGIEMLFYKANNFLWNISQFAGYDKYEEIVIKKLFDLLENRSVYEWVNYHIINTLIQFKNFSRKDYREIYDILNSSESPLIRKACYKFLIFHLEPGEQLFSKVRMKLEMEKVFMLKAEIFNDIKVSKDNKLDLQVIIQSLGI